MTKKAIMLLVMVIQISLIVTASFKLGIDFWYVAALIASGYIWEKLKHGE